MGRIRANIESRVRKGAMTKAAAEAALGRVRGVLDYKDFKVRVRVWRELMGVLTGF